MALSLLRSLAFGKPIGDGPNVMSYPPKILVWSFLFFGGATILSAAQESSNNATNSLQIGSVLVEGKPVTLTHDGQARLNSFPQAIAFTFGPKAGVEHDWVRLRHKMEGYEDRWAEQPCH